MARKKRERQSRGSPAWMTTFGDMNSLLLTFFVMMFTVAEIQGDEMRLILSAFQGNLGALSGGMTLAKGKLEDMGMTIESLPSQTYGKKLSKALKRAESILKPEIEAKIVRVEENERGIVITLLNDAFFPVGSADIVFPSTKNLLERIAYLLTEVSNYIRVEGHTDNQPVRKGPFASNWELSTQRAVNIVKYFLESLNREGRKDEAENLARRISAAGYAEFRPLPGNNNSTPEERAQNRRVEIILLWKELAR